MNKNHEEKRYYFDLENAWYCYPYKVSNCIKNLGVLEKYRDKRYTQKEINRIIAELMIKVPYIENSMDIEFSAMYKDDKNCISYYHQLCFRNIDFKNQEKADKEVKFLYPNEIL